MNHESINNLPKIDLHCHLDGSLSADFIKHCIGEELTVPEEIQKAYKPIRLDKPVISPSDIDYVTSVLNSLNLLRIFY